jgi:hypothetical protein
MTGKDGDTPNEAPDAAHYIVSLAQELGELAKTHELEALAYFLIWPGWKLTKSANAAKARRRSAVSRARPGRRRAIPSPAMSSSKSTIRTTAGELFDSRIKWSICTGAGPSKLTMRARSSCAGSTVSPAAPSGGLDCGSRAGRLLLLHDRTQD